MWRRGGLPEYRMQDFMSVLSAEKFPVPSTAPEHPFPRRSCSRPMAAALGQLLAVFKQSPQWLR
jgi:hypothetical protein